MAKLTKIDEFQERLGIQMDHVKARLLDLKAQGRKLKLEARLDYDKSLRALEKKEEELKAQVAEWKKAGSAAGKDLKKGIDNTAKSLTKALDDAFRRFK